MIRDTLAPFLISTALAGIGLLELKPARAQSADVETGSQARSHWKYLMSGWRAEREKLKSYEVKVKGVEQHYPGLSKTMELTGTPEKVDLSLRLLATDLGPRMKSEIQWGKDENSSGVWTANADYVAGFARNNAPIVLLSRLDEERPRFALKMQPGAAGFLGMSDFRYHNIVDQIQFVYESLVNQSAIYELKKVGLAVHQALVGIEASSNGQKYYEMHQIVLNEGRGFTIESRNNYPAERPDDVSHPVDTIVRARWIQRDGVWLPEKIEDLQLNTRTRTDLAFDWISVNEPLPEREFDLEALGAPKGTIIADQRLGRDKTIVVGHIGGDKDVPPTQSLAPPVRTSTVLIASAGALLALVAIVALTIAWRRLIGASPAPEGGRR